MLARATWAQLVQHALQVVIEGFKTYKDQTISEPLDQHINVVGDYLHHAAVSGWVCFLIVTQSSADVS